MRRKEERSKQGQINIYMDTYTSECIITRATHQHPWSVISMPILPSVTASTRTRGNSLGQQTNTTQHREMGGDREREGECCGATDTLGTHHSVQWRRTLARLHSNIHVHVSRKGPM